MSDAVAVVTDSLADLGPLAAECDIAVVPLTITFGNEQYRDGVDLTTEEFYAKLQASTSPPITAQPPPGAFIEAYRRLLEGGAAHVVSIHFSSTLSGTFNVAALAAREVNGKRITVIDSRTASAGVGMLALQAREAARRGEPAEAIVERVRAAVPKVQLFAAIPNLTYLARGGRITQIQSLVGNVLRIVPILHLVDGEIKEFAKVRTFARAVEQMVEAVIARAKGKRARCAVVHALAPDAARSLSERLRSEIDPQSIITCLAGSSIGTHAGPGALGVIFIE